MNAPARPFVFSMTEAKGFADLSSVYILCDVTTDEGEVVVSGTRGTIVSVYADGAAYEVEFEAGTATIEAASLRAA